VPATARNRTRPAAAAVPHSRSSACLTRGAFTLVELLLVVVVIAILAALLLPVLSRAQSKAKQAFCVNNLKQLALCTQMYAADNDGKLVENPESVPTFGGNPGNESTNAWVLGNMKRALEATNESFVRRGQLFAYARSPSLFHCPADRSQSNGVARTRSYSMNGWLGSRRMDFFSTYLRFRTFVKESELAAAGPARIWGIMDEYESSIDDGWFMVTMDDSRVFVNLPAMRHRNSYSLNFGDGHTETYKILQTTIFGLQSGGFGYNSPDWLRLKQVTTVQ